MRCYRARARHHGHEINKSLCLSARPNWFFLKKWISIEAFAWLRFQFCSTMPAKRRKLLDENRHFNIEWEEEFFVIEDKNACACLICDSRINIFKKSNISDHFLSKHGSYDEKYPKNTQVRSAKLTNLKAVRQTQRRLLSSFKSTNLNEKSVKASYKVSWLLAQAKKPYSDIELIKKCSEVLVEEISEDQNLITKLKTVPLSADTATRRVSSCIADIDQQISDKMKKFLAISIAVDESTDIRDIAQCCIFFRGIDNEYNVVEDILHLHPLTDRTRGEDIFKCVMDVLKQFSVPIRNIFSITTDGAPAMLGKNVGFVSLFKYHTETRDDIITYHCLLHQENLSALRCEMFEDVMTDVVTVVNYIRASAMNHREFRNLLNEYDTQYGELLYHSQVRWLSKGMVLSHFFHLIDAIKEFLSDRTNLPEKVKSVRDRMSHGAWIERVAFLTDITGHLNTLNLQLQGKKLFITDMFHSVTAFENKLHLFSSQLSSANVMHFERLQLLKNKKWKFKDLNLFIECVESLKFEFKTRFTEFRSKKIFFSLVSNPWIVQPEELIALPPFLSTENLSQCQLELIELQANDVLKRQHSSSDSPLKFWKTVHHKNLRYISMVVSSMFGSTFSCEQTFSSLNFVKNKLRNRLSNTHTSELVKAAVTNFVPNFEKLSAEIQAQPSH